MADATRTVVPNRGDLYIAPAGTSIPTDPESVLPADWKELGYVGQDGATFNRNIDIEEFFAWQERTSIRREVTEEETAITFELLEWSEANFVFAFGGGEVTETSPGLYHYEFPTGADALGESALILRWQDGDKHYQLGFERGSPTDEVEFELNRSNMSVLPVTFEALAGEDSSGVTFDTDDPAFEPEGS